MAAVATPRVYLATCAREKWALAKIASHVRFAHAARVKEGFAHVKHALTTVAAGKDLSNFEEMQLSVWHAELERALEASGGSQGRKPKPAGSGSRSRSRCPPRAAVGYSLAAASRGYVRAALP